MSRHWIHLPCQHSEPSLQLMGQGVHWHLAGDIFFSLYIILVTTYLFFPALCKRMMLEQDTSSQGQATYSSYQINNLGCMFPVVLLTNLWYHKMQSYCLPVAIFISETVPNIHSFPLSLHKSKLYYLQCSPPWNW